MIIPKDIRRAAYRVRLLFLLFALFFSGFACFSHASDKSHQHNVIEWEGKKERFLVVLSLSSFNLKIDEQLKISLRLSFPSDDQPDLQNLRKNLLEYSGFGPAPFILAQEIVYPVTVKEDISSQKVDFFLLLEVTGSYFLSLKNIIFNKKSNSDDNLERDLIEIPTPVFSIQIEVPKLVFNPEAVISPLLQLSERPPISMSLHNKENYLLNRELHVQQALQAILFINRKNVPWFAIFAFFFIAFVFIAIKIAPASLPKSVLAVKPDAASEAAREIEAIINRHLPEQGRYGELFIQLDQAVRDYVESKYKIPARSLTTQEFLEKSSGNMEVEMRHRILQFLQNADRVKFSHYIPSDNECLQAIEAVQSLKRVFLNTL